MSHVGLQAAEPGSGTFVMTEDDFLRAGRFLRQFAGVKLDASKKTLVYARLTKRLRAVGLRSFSDYFDHIESDEGGKERVYAISQLTTHVTKFFREEHHFATLASAVVPSLLEAARKGERVRIWSAGCSSGEEPYSIGMTILEADPRAADYDLRILATDIDPLTVAVGREGLYADSLLADIPRDRRQKFFERQTGEVSAVCGQLRRLVAFKTLNLLQADDWPMRFPMDVVFCRNTVIYFDQPAQERVWARMSSRIKSGGYLFIGHSERVSENFKSTFALKGTTTYVRQ
jgi:chemotaxis protein methyltransferase CheR